MGTARPHCAARTLTTAREVPAQTHRGDRLSGVIGPAYLLVVLVLLVTPALAAARPDNRAFRLASDASFGLLALLVVLYLSGQEDDTSIDDNRWGAHESAHGWGMALVALGVLGVVFSVGARRERALRWLPPVLGWLSLPLAFALFVQTSH